MRIERWVAWWWTKEDKGHPVFENCMPKLFHKRSEARKFIQDKYGYIKTRKDLREYPHYWRLPKAVKVSVNIEQV